MRDNVTGLVWQQETTFDLYTRQQAEDHCATLTLAGCGWRLPSRIELVSLVDFTKESPGPTIDTTAFPNTVIGNYWTSSPLAGDSSNGWAIDFRSADIYNNNVHMLNMFLVRCVR